MSGPRAVMDTLDRSAPPARHTPAPGRLARLAAGAPPALVVVIDTEEEFDWSADFDRGAISVRHLRSVERLQAVFDQTGVRPVYAIDHPVATQADGYEPLRAIADSGRAEIAAHLHPWVSPPFDEELTAENSYPGNLPRELEREKLAGLCAAIEERFGARPRAYKAGRYGFGPHTARTLGALGFEVDLSPCPAFDLRADGGPDWSRWPAGPCWLDAGDGRRVLSVPTSGAFVGRLAARGPKLHRLASGALGTLLHFGGVLARLGLVERLMLSPEGHGAADLERLTRALHARGERVFCLSLHSPSIEPGHTPYVRDEAERVQFLERLRRYLDFVLGELGARSMTASELCAHLTADLERADPTHQGAAT